jgi:hypothetical protein
VAQPEADQALLGAPLPVQAQAQRGPTDLQAQRHPIAARQRDPQAARPAVVEPQGEGQHPRLGVAGLHFGPPHPDQRATLLGGDDALGELQQDVVGHAVAGPPATGPQQRAPAPPHGERERPGGHLHCHLTAHELEIARTDG